MRKPLILQHPIAVAALLVALLAMAGAMAASISPKVSFETQLRISQMALIVVLLTMAGLALYFRDWTKGVLTRFFYAISRPLNLAFYRVVAFATIFLDLDFDADPKIVLFFANLPKELQFPPPGLGPLLSVLPINEVLARLALAGLTTFSFLAMIGLFTRFSAWMTVACALYALGIAQFYGQVNHYHHMFWFAAILAASRCADVLSVDAFLAARRRGAELGNIEPPGESRAYALPLRFVWLTIGIIYFFPGFWKYWRSGMDWAFSDNFANQLHLKWMQRDGWMPFFRIDQYPFLYQPAAFITMMWEMMFLPAMFFPRLRLAGAVVGAMFHIGTRVLMHIGFWTLQTSYLSLFNWDGIFRRLGRRMYADELFFLYDGNDIAIRRRLASWRTLDVFFNRITYINIHDQAALAAAGMSGAVDVNGVRAVLAGQTFEGGAAWRAAAKRIPPLWPVVPFVGRETSGPTEPVPATATAVGWVPRHGLAGVTAVFSILLAGNLLFGFKEARTGYPFTCYPPFSRNPGPEALVIHVEPIDANGNPIEWDELKLKKRFGSARYVSMIKLLRLKKNPKQLRAFWEVVRQENPHLADAHGVRFWETRFRTDPAFYGRNMLGRELVYEYHEDGAPGPGSASEVLTVADDITKAEE